MAGTELQTRFVRRLLAWGRENRRTFPWRSIDDPFRILVAEVLLQRSRAKTVAKVYHELFSRWPDEADLAAAEVEEIASIIRPLGLTSRAQNLKALAARIVELGQVPRTQEGLMALPGVGRYAANATLVAAFNRPVPVVDGVTARVYRRQLGLANGVAPVADEELWRTVGDVMPKRAARDWNWAVLDLAASICLPKVPRCSLCPLERTCSYVLDPVRTG